MRGLEGKVAFVTGAGRGIGEAIAKRLAAEGAKVAVADIIEDNARQTADAIGAAAIAIAVDVTNSAAVRAAVAECEKRLGPIDVLVNNAGWDKIEPFIESREETWDKVIAINLKGPIICIRAVLEGMIARGKGRIVSIASDAGRVGSTGEAVYSGAKSGLIGFSKTLAREMARHHINVNVVCPGPTGTPLLKQAMQNSKLMESLVRAVPFRRLAEPDEIASAVAFLASDDAGFITGQTLSVSGGLTMI
ncbi:MAG: 3-oxoacyl-ACP reductase family protein [Candidatus Binatus sp.]|uniref:SDR family NAD(P)-dependent oxidoreductase n=1 Tax=Candidatus Binatus sp. TaxID=2811406 RepID=UPI00272261C2|nr:3-oxoacyl-ACP reductase family protein [Candidatus Binatus sp.]MDO8432198.1 3-oxoacyl-ACP reductase family protein [Candidatus Binatus sp.]